MRQATDKYKYKQLETYKEIFELRHIKTKTLVVNILNFVFAVIVGYFLIRLEIETNTILGVLFIFFILFVINLALYSYGDDLYNNLKLSMYMNTIGEYVLAITLIVIFQTPSIFTALFLAYAVTSIYQDYKVMLLSNGALFVGGFLLALSFDDIFSIPDNTATQNVYIMVFLILFVALLTLSSYILIKRKSFFYNHLAQIKESEVRNMDLLVEIEEKRFNRSLDLEQYYKSLKTFSKELSKKIGVENVFDRKIKLLIDLKKYKPSELLKRYPEYTEDQIKEINNLELAINTKMRNIGIKSSKTTGISISQKEIFSESQFKSFKHLHDEHYVKIIGFVVFYILIKIDKPYLSELPEQQIRDIFENSEYYYLVDRDILEVYLKNNDVFDTVVKDLLKGEWTYETNI